MSEKQHLLEFDRRVVDVEVKYLVTSLWYSMASCQENSAHSKTTQSEKIADLGALESTGERQAPTRVSTAQLAFENSRLECPRGRTV